MTNPKISVLLPVHNGQPYLGGAVESILRQSFRDFELIILDDASSDGSETEALRYADQDSRIRVVRAHENIGLGAQLNRGISLAQGELIARMDADDIAFPERFLQQVGVFDRDPDIGVCGTKVKIISSSGLPSGEWNLPFHHDDIVSGQFVKCGFCHPSIMIRANVLNAIDSLYREDFVVAQDYEFWQRILKRTRGMNIDAPLLSYRRFPEQLSQSRLKEKEAEYQFILRSVRNDIGLEDSEINKEMHRSFVADAWPARASWFCKMIDWLNGVYTANLDSRAIPRAAFGKLLAERLYMQCHMATGKGINGKRLFRNAVFKHHMRVGVVQSIKTSVKSIIH